MALSEMARAKKSISQLKMHLEKSKKLSANFKIQYELAEQYYSDAKHYFGKGDYFTSFGCSDYAYGLLDAIQFVKERQYFPEPVVGAIILNSKNEVFLMRSHKWHGKYVVPGGHIELGESAEQALVREVKEETNLDIYDISHVITHEFIHDLAFWKKRHFIMFDYICHTKNLNKIKLNDEGQEYVWMDFEKALKSKEIEPFTLKALKAAALQTGRKTNAKRNE
jgi:nucleoside triphosphatase